MEVRRFLSLEKSDPERKKIIDKIRKEGDFGSGEAIAVQNKTKIENSDNSKLLPCTHCRGYYARSTLRRHVKRCFFNTSNNKAVRQGHQSTGQTLMAGHFEPCDPLRTSGVLDSLRADYVSLVAKRDKTICEVGRRYVKWHKEKPLTLVAKRYMRRLARLLIEVREIDKDKSLNFISLLHPSKFKIVVQAIKSISAYNSEKKTFNSPSLALQMGTLIKKAISAAYSMELQKNINSSQMHSLNDFKKLIEEEWAIEVSTEAGQHLQINRCNKPTIIPLTEDLGKMKMADSETTKTVTSARVVKAWTEEEKRVAKTFFKNHIKKKIAPKKHEVLKLMENHPHLFSGRKWDSIKAYAYNQYKDK